MKRIISIPILSLLLINLLVGCDSSNTSNDENILPITSTSLPISINMLEIPGGTFIMGSDNLMGSPKQRESAPEHQVTLSTYYMSEAEITNAQYVEFLNSAYNDGLLVIAVDTTGPSAGHRLIKGTALSTYEGKVLYDLDGTRVLKDHDDADGDGNPFTGSVEPENPLNIAYIGFDESNDLFYVKNPHDLEDFNWYEICNYQDYGSIERTVEPTILNDFENWAGAGSMLSNELEGWTESNPEEALNLPTQSDVSDWPVTFIRWWGAKAFVDYYGASLPTEAQWEYAAKAGLDYQYAVYDGVDVSDANWNQTGPGIAYGHVRNAISGAPNPFGLYNLGGNAWEWIADNYVDTYGTDHATDPLVEISGSTTRCWRGGSWNYHMATLQSSIRFFDEESHGNDHFGFRVVINVD